MGTTIGGFSITCLGMPPFSARSLLVAHRAREAADLRNDYCLSMAGEKGKRRKRRPRKRDNPAQSRKFIEAARKLGLDTTSSKDFDNAFSKVVKRKNRGGSS